MWWAAGKRPHRTAGAALIVAACTAAAAAGWQLWRMNAAISGGAFLSAANIGANAVALLALPSLRLYAPLTLLALIGAVVLIGRRRPAVWLLLVAAATAALVVLAYDRFHQRMLLAAVAALLPLTAFAAPAGRPPGGARRGQLAAGALLIAVVLVWLPDIVAVATPPETQLLESRIAARIAAADLPANGLLIAPHPTVVHAAGGPTALSARAAADDTARLDAAVASGAPVYILCDMFCESDFDSSGTPAWCSDVFARFAVRPLLEESLHSRTYGVYQLIGPGRGDAPPPCPRR
jgi:hypothetical protein